MMPTGVQPWVMPLTTSGSHQKYVYVPGVGVCVGTGTLLSTAGVAPAEVPVGEEEKTEEVDTGHVNWHRDSCSYWATAHLCSIMEEHAPSCCSDLNYYCILN